MAQLIIRGGCPLRGRVKLSGAKNSSFKLMIAGVLIPGETKLTNVANIGEVNHVGLMIEALGGRVSRNHSGEVTISGRGINRWQVQPDMGEVSRASALFLGPLLARFGQATVPFPGGDAIGHRPLDRHLAGLRQLGAKISLDKQFIYAKGRLKGAKIEFNKVSHTGTENLLMAAVLAEGKTTIRNCATEPEVDDLINFLNLAGGKIRRQGRNLEIIGVGQLQPLNFSVMPDRNQAVSYAVAALATKGEVVIDNARPEHLTAFLEKLNQTGAGVETAKTQIRIFYNQPLKSVSIMTRPHPGFMTDWQPLWSLLMTQARGKAKVVEAVFTHRFQFVPDLIKMGADIAYFDPQPKNPEKFFNFNLSDDQPGNRHGICVNGQTPLHGGEFAVKDIRNGATLAIAGLTASGQTILNQAELIDRGYENFAGSLINLGARILVK